jgi:hypothetical protein
MPPRAKAAFTQGMQNLSKLDESSRQKVFDAFLAQVPDFNDMDATEIARKSSVEEDLLGPIMLVLAVLTVGFSSYIGSVDQFVTYLRASIDFGAEAAPVVRPFLESIDGLRGTISSALSKDALSNEILPTLVQASTAVDLRVRFKGKTIDLATAVLVVSLTTDTRSDDFILQVPKTRLKRLVEQLREGLDRLESAEKQMLPPRER